VRRLFAAAPGESDSGLRADVVELGARHGYTGPDPREGGGQVILVLQGSIVYAGREMGARSALAVTGDEKPVSFAADAKGVQALVLQYPRRDGVKPMTAPH
jgi:hypothetical protein